MSLTRTRAALELIEAHVDASKPDSFIVSALTQFVAVVFYAEMEERVGESISTQLHEFTNSPIGHFLTNNMEKIIRRVPKSDISDVVSSFGEKFKEAFNTKISDKEVSFYSNVITARHNIGHRQGSNITLDDVRRGLEAADKILGAIAQCFAEVAKK
jgi:hypothetical protein